MKDQFLLSGRSERPDLNGTIITQAGLVFSTAGSVNLLTLNGRALSLGASVTMVNTVITVPAP